MLLAISGCDGVHSQTDREAASSIDESVETITVPESAVSMPSSRQRESPLRFEDVTENSGVYFLWSGGPTARQNMTEQNGGGVGIIDFDCDLIPDLCLVNTVPFELSEDGSPRGASRLFRGSDFCQFQDVSPSARFAVRLVGMGIAAGDFDSDGFTDLFISGFYCHALLRNLGDGTFEDVTPCLGNESSYWETSAAFADLDADGWLDLFVTTYVDWNTRSPTCHSEQDPKLLQICSPSSFSAQPDLLFRNLSSGFFEETGDKSGFAELVNGKGLAVEIADFDENGMLDVFVANDTTPNSMFLNHGSQTFIESGIQMGVAVSEDGTHGASMGIGCADYDRDGHLDLFVTNFRNQVNDLFGGLGANGFVPQNARSGINSLSLNKLAFGAVFSDFDLDGWPDLFVANGHIWDLKSLDPRSEYQMTADLLRNDHGQFFRDVSSGGGSYFERKWLARSVAVSDLDNDGDHDLVIQHVGDPTVILKNVSQRYGTSVKIRFIGVNSAREPLGCRVEVLSDDSWQTLHIPSGGSFQASHDSRLLATLSNRDSLREVRITWPDGRVESWRGSSLEPVKPQLTLIEGTGTTVKTGQ